MPKAWSEAVTAVLSSVFFLSNRLFVVALDVSLSVFSAVQLLRYAQPKTYCSFSLNIFLCQLVVQN